MKNKKVAGGPTKGFYTKVTQGGMIEINQVSYLNWINVQNASIAEVSRNAYQVVVRHLENMEALDSPGHFFE